MLTWQARLLNLGAHVLLRRRNWGNDAGLVRRARRVFGAPAPLQWLRTRGLSLEPLAPELGPGEMVVPPNPRAGAVLYFHGGGYVSGSPATHRPITAGLARRCQQRVFVPDYRRAPEHRYPAALDDAVALYRRLLDAGYEPAQMSVAGDSAGGGLVLSALVRWRDLGLPLPAAAVCFSPWSDLSASGPSVREMDGHCHLFRTENIGAFARIYLGETAADDPGASPLFADLSGLPPVLLQVGSTELLVDDARRVESAIRAAGGACELVEYPDALHCWQMMDGLVPEATRALDEAAQFLVGNRG